MSKSSPFSAGSAEQREVIHFAKFRQIPVRQNPNAILGNPMPANSPSTGVLVAMIEAKGAPVELMQIDHLVRKDL
jgi:hypothetical protein